MRERNGDVADVLPMSVGCDAGVVDDGPKDGVWARDMDVGCDVHGGVKIDRVVEFKDPLWREQLVGWNRRESIRERIFFQKNFQQPSRPQCKCAVDPAGCQREASGRRTLCTVH